MKSILHGRLIFGLLFLFLALGSFADGRYIPVYDDGIRVDYKHYCLGFNKEHKQANWVYYELGSANLTGKASRKNDFRVTRRSVVGAPRLTITSGAVMIGGICVPRQICRLTRRR